MAHESQRLSVSRHWQCPIIGQWNEKDTKMEIRRGGSQPSNKGSEEYFTGAVRMDPHFPGRILPRVVSTGLTFEPGARTAWHTHPLGQTLIVTAGCGWAQQHDGTVEEIRPGDVIWFPPGAKHWHGAARVNADSFRR